MKIGQYLRDLYASQAELYGRLQAKVDDFMEQNKDPNWHYIGRLKGIESYALKIETGRTKPDDFEDFFACTLVVENLGSMAKAERLVKRRFKLKERRPETNTTTTKPSDSFRFDDTRLYVRWRDNKESRPTGLNGLIFEVQIKTFLAHAWSVATHDLTYKTDEKSWPKERIAFQIKAMLEHAEVSIDEAKKLAKTPSLNKTNEVYRRISEIIDVVNDLWPAEALPEDRKRLAENIDHLVKGLGITLARLQEIIVEETKAGRGTNITSLSPYCTIIQSLIKHEPDKIFGYLDGSPKDFKIYMSCELELPSSWDVKKANNAVLDPINMSKFI